MIYLDYAAHAPADPVVLERFCDMERRFPANPNSVHMAGKTAREEMARVTEQIAALTGASPAEVIFTSGATEANNLAIKGIAQASRHIGKHIISTPLEHSSVSGSLTARLGDRPALHRSGRHSGSRGSARASASGYRSRCHLRGGQRAWHHSAGKRNRSAAG